MMKIGLNVMCVLQHCHFIQIAVVHQALSEAVDKVIVAFGIEIIVLFPIAEILVVLRHLVVLRSLEGLVVSVHGQRAWKHLRHHRVVDQERGNCWKLLETSLK